jgi:hypothetical protein
MLINKKGINRFFCNFCCVIIGFVLGVCQTSLAQVLPHVFSFANIPLPAELENANQQFSGLYIYDNKLYLLPECRLQDNQEAAIYSIELQSLDSVITKAGVFTRYKKIPLKGLDILRKKMDATGNEYEGTEAITLQGSSVYFSIETTTPSANCFLLKGKWQNDTIVMDTTLMFALRKPTKVNGEHIYNAGFESVMPRNGKLFCWFEYNSFESGSYVYVADTSLINIPIDSIAMQQLPFRITDITAADSNNAIAINYFYKGGGRDEVYRPAENDSCYKIVHNDSGYFSYNRLIKLHVEQNAVTWKPVGDFPVQFWGYNWEGIAAYKNGYFIINDKYTDKRPYKSVLLYIKP